MERLINGGASVLAMEAGRVMVVDQEKVIDMANRAKISIACV
jgi:DUF1009 family protein